MSTKCPVKLDPDVYDRVAAQKRDDGTFSRDPEREAELREAVERAEEADHRDLEELEERRDSIRLK